MELSPVVALQNCPLAAVGASRLACPLAPATEASTIDTYLFNTTSDGYMVVIDLKCTR
eukprot:COSAG01_NODE_7669_length_3082_cov_4.090486_3_plen_58_part_00